MDQSKMPIADKLNSYRDSGRLSMHIPGHKGRSSFSAADRLVEILGEKAVAADITEIAGFDDFHEPEGIILEAQQLAAEVFGADETFFLTNGTTSGIMAAIAAAAGEGERILIARDSHKSVTRGLVLSGASPVYIRPYTDPETLLSAGISAEDVRSAFEKDPDIKAVVLTHPTYYGTYSDLREIVKIAHEYGALVIADEAHGAHLMFSGQSDIPSAMEAGADISIQSTHKMLGSLTQSSMLHVQGRIADREKLRYYISLMTSTSPSYLLMASLDAVRHRMAEEGRELWADKVAITTAAAYALSAIKGIDVVREFTGSDGQKRALERCRLLISAAGCGLGGRQLADMLFEDHLIDVEFSDDMYVLAVTGANTHAHDFAALEGALRYISNHNYDADRAASEDLMKTGRSGIDHAYAGMSGVYYKSRMLSFDQVQAVSPRKAVSAPKTMKRIGDCEGMISAREIAVYPPGIPCIHPGEVFTKEVIDFIIRETEKGTHIHGLSRIDSAEGTEWMAAVADMR